MLRFICLLVLFAVVMSVEHEHEADSSMKVHDRSARGILDCAKLGKACWPGKRCCGSTYCHRDKAWHPRGICKACQGANSRCSRGSQCCSGNCQKEGIFKIFGKCS